MHLWEKGANPPVCAFFLRPRLKTGIPRTPLRKTDTPSENGSVSHFFQKASYE